MNKSRIPGAGVIAGTAALGVAVGMFVGAALEGSSNPADTATVAACRTAEAAASRVDSVVAPRLNAGHFDTELVTVLDRAVAALDDYAASSAVTGDVSAAVAAASDAYAALSLMTTDYAEADSYNLGVVDRNVRRAKSAGAQVTDACGTTDA